MIRSALSVVVMSAMLASTSALAEPVRVTVDSGVLVGELKNGVRSFQGIPYAKPPVGALRWPPPQK